MASAGKRLGQEQVEQIVAASQPERLSGPGKHPIPGDHAANAVQLVAWGQTTLASDHLLFPEINGSLPAVVGGVIRQLNIRFASARQAAGEARGEVEQKVRARQ